MYMKEGYWDVKPRIKSLESFRWICRTAVLS